MYEAKYQKYISKSHARFAEKEEILKTAKPAFSKGEKAAGVPLLYDNGKLYVDNEDNHTFVIGPTGCKKSRVVVYSTVSSIIESGESAVINDPKGEIYRRTAKRAKKLGAEVVLINFRKPSMSAGWNPLIQAKKFEEAGQHDEALQCINDFAETIAAPALKTTVDVYWAESSKSYLVGLALTLMASLPENLFNLHTFIPFCYENSQRYLKSIMEGMDQSSVAVFGLRTLLDLEAEKTKSCIYSTILSILRPLAQNKSLLDMLCCDSVDLANIGKKQTLVYIIYPDEKDNLNFLVNLFLTQCYETLINVATNSPGDKLPVRVNFVLDEFSNLVPINNFANRISEARSKNIRYFLFVQSFGQLRQKYGDYAETIISNCNNWICFSSKEMEFLTKISRICGTEVDYNGREHELLSAFEMQHFRKKRENSEVLIIKQGQYPFVTELPDFDYIDIASKYEEDVISEKADVEERKIISVTPYTWREMIRDSVFSYPYAASAS